MLVATAFGGGDALTQILAGRGISAASVAINPAPFRGVLPLGRHGNPDRGPMLVISGEKDNTVPHSIAHASFELQQRNAGITEFTELPNRGHSLTIDNGWREVADAL